MSVCQTFGDENNVITIDYDGMRFLFRRWRASWMASSDCVSLISPHFCTRQPCLKIWVRNYQILEEQPTNALEAHLAKKQSGQEENTSLVEIGPRFVLNPIRIFRGSFGGQTLFQNPDFVSPNEIRSMQHKRKGLTYENRKDAQKKRKTRLEQLVLPDDPLDGVFR